MIISLGIILTSYGPWHTSLVSTNNYVKYSGVKWSEVNEAEKPSIMH